MPKRKLQRFRDIETFNNVFQPAFNEIFKNDFYLKGKWNTEYFGNTNPITLELGCGRGEYTTGMAQLFPANNYIGIDIKGARIWKGAHTALKEKLYNVAFIRTHIECAVSLFAKEEIDNIWITFPDPQIKKKKKRLTSARFLNFYRLFIKNNARIRLKTDNLLLFEYTLNIVNYNGFKIIHNTKNLYNSEITDKTFNIKTYYEQQFLSKNMKINYLCFELNNEKTVEEPPEQ